MPAACFAASLRVLVADKDHIKEESHDGILFHPTARMKVNYSPTFRAGPWLYIAGKTAGNVELAGAAPPPGLPAKYGPPGLPHHFSDNEIAAHTCGVHQADRCEPVRLAALPSCARLAGGRERAH